ncbi:conserved hypothetical protein [Theileria orientalis strain Shintoku]|uniref:Uncharacterized protein n=1 Tax=Theileria orientalis strain Shintoku TaxID=869250 RepID=J7M8H6_THEOR|nr:conserved hypothetical protein [Theileria orientalis strain Shintoku]BAM42308.1 conserved hypothetical protein [Theileria orientalis strain Shintoku]|eukprot:XP_009692609.1 conserved hypothetical protein [Theileria orientalis strain Shintoku]
MKKNKNNAFKTTKSRVGKQHLRKFKSEDEKLLSNLSRVKKTVKLTTQSISINKDALNITSRRLTFPELVGKSRHTSENVRNHALLGLIEFVRRYEEEGRINVYTLLQVSCASIFNESSKLRTSSKNLLMLVLATYFGKKNNRRGSEIIHLYLKQGIICCNGSRDASFYDDVYGLVGAVAERYPWVLVEYKEKLLECMLKNTPEAPSFKHFSSVYSLFKLNTSIDRKTREDLIEYVIIVQYKMLSNTRVNDNYKVNSNHESNVSEIECLSIASMTVKSLKLLLSNSEHIKQNDQRIVDLLLSVDLYEFESMTERGKQTYDKLFGDFIQTKLELALRLLKQYTRHHLPLLVPLIQAESLKESIESSRLVEMLYKAHSANGYNTIGKKDVSLKVKSEWVGKILSILSESKLKTNQQLKTYLNQLVSGTGNNEMGNEEEGNVRKILVNMYYEALNSMFESVVESPVVWPFICYMKGVSPVVFKEIFDKTHNVSAYNSTPSAFSAYRSTMDTGKPYRGIELDFERVMSHFIGNMEEHLVGTFIKMCLHISSNDRKTNIYYKLSEIKNLKEEEYMTLSKIYLNMEASGRLNEHLSQTITDLYRKKYVRAVKDCINALLFQLFNIKEEGRVDRQGRVVINFDVEGEVKEKVEYFMEFAMNFIRLITGEGSSVGREEKMEENGSTQDSLINYMIKTFMDKYLTVMCKVDNNEDMSSTVRELIEESLRPHCESIEKGRRKRVYKIIKEVLVEYMNKESVPEWVTAELE